MKSISDYPSTAWISIGETGEYINGFAFKPSDRHENGSPIIRIQNLTRIEHEINRTNRKVPEKYLVKNGDILVSWSATLDAFIWHGEDALVNQHIFKVVPNTSIVDATYLYHVLRWAIRKLTQTTDFHGSTMKHINRKPFIEFKLPIPKKQDQHHIAQQLEELFSDLDAATAALDRVRANLKRYRASVLKSAVEGKLTAEWRAKNPPKETGAQLLERILLERRAKWEENQLAKFKAQGKEPPKGWREKYPEPAKPDTTNLPGLPDGWVWASLESIAAFQPHAIKAGPFGSALKKEMYKESGFKIYGQEQVLRGDPYFGDYFIDEAKYRQLESCAVKPGDLLVSLVGTIGKTLVLPADCLPGIINPRLVKLSLNRHILIPRFIEYYLAAPQVRASFKMISHGGTMDILNLSILNELPYPLPPIQEQKEIVENLELQFANIDAILNDNNHRKKAINTLRQAILKQAFEGKLVPQDPTDEPASELLKRIREERALTPSPSPRGRGGKTGGSHGRRRVLRGRIRRQNDELRLGERINRT